MASRLLRALAAALAAALMSPPIAGAVVNEITVVTSAGQSATAKVALVADLPVLGALYKQDAPGAPGAKPGLLLYIQPNVVDEYGQPVPPVTGSSSSTAPPPRTTDPPKADTGLLLIVKPPGLVPDGSGSSAAPAAADAPSAEQRAQWAESLRRSASSVVSASVATVTKEDEDRLQARVDQAHQGVHVGIDAEIVEMSTWTQRQLGIDPRTVGALLEGVPTGGLGAGAGGTPFVGTTDAAGRVAVDFHALQHAPSPNTMIRVTAATGANSTSATFPLVQLATATSLTMQVDATLDCVNACFQTSDGQPQSEPEKVHTVKLPAIVAQAGPAPVATGPGGEAMRTQPALRKLGLPLDLPWRRLAPVTVAVIDTGLDYRHPVLRPHHLWANPRPGADPRYPDDAIGWNFVDGHNNPWDDSGHGTFVAGLVLAVNPRARIMPIKVMNTFGAGVTSNIARAVVYAVDRGARVINLSLGAEGVSKLSQAVVDYARARGAVIVVAAGNEAGEADKHTPVNVRGVLAVGALDAADRKPGFANYGLPVALVAPAVDVVSLRARSSDFVLLVTGGKDYTPGRNIVGTDRWHYRATGTSFSAPLVAGAASLLLSIDPSLTGGQVERMLVESADDVETPGWDQFTGNGRLNIVRALAADPNRSLVAKVARLVPAQQGGRTVVQVFGAADGNSLASYQLQLGRGESPTGWKTLAVERGKSVADGLLGAFPASEINARGEWTVRLIAQDAAGRTREARGTLDVR